MPKAQRAPRRAPDTRVRLSRDELNNLRSRAGLADVSALEAQRKGEEIAALQRTIQTLEDDRAAAAATVFAKADGLLRHIDQRDGAPKPNYDCVAAMTAAYLTRRGTTAIDAYDVALMNILTRVASSAVKRDGALLVEIAALARQAEQIAAAA